MKEKDYFKPIQWHPAFRGAIKTELASSGHCLQFEDEYSLTKKELKIDLLIIKQVNNKKTNNSIGHIFRNHNILEYKSPKDYISIDDFYKVYAYACIYKSDTAVADKIKIDSITITFACSYFPHKMIEHLEGIRGYTIYQYQKGIYYIQGDFLPIQLLVISELDKKEHKWLNGLTYKIHSDLLEDILSDYDDGMKDENKDVVIDTIINANKILIERLKEASSMSGELIALMKPEIEQLAKQMAEQLSDQKAEKLAYLAKEKFIIDMIKEGISITKTAKIVHLPKKEIQRILKEVPCEN